MNCGETSFKAQIMATGSEEKRRNVPKDDQKPSQEAEVKQTNTLKSTAKSLDHRSKSASTNQNSVYTNAKSIPNGKIYPSEDKQKVGDDQNGVALQVLLIFVCSLVFMAVVFYNIPELDDEDVSRLRLPRTIDDAKDLGRLFSKYKDTHYYTVLGAIVATYIFLQTFAIPGSISLSILSGFLFPFPMALFLVCMCSATGATFCYYLSAMVGHKLVKKYFPERLKSWRAQAAHHHDDMLWYIIFLRITPFLPNWFINLASPVIGVKVTPFYLGTFLGVAPPSFFFIRAGTTLYQLTTATGHISLRSFVILGVMALLSLMPVFFKRAIRKKLK